MISKWLDFTKENVIDFDFYEKTTKFTLLEVAIIMQAKEIYKDIKNPVVFVSGGIDSQTMAYAFIKANLPVKFVNFRFIYDNERVSKSEQFYVREFFDKYKTPYETIDIHHTKDSLWKLFEQHDHFNTGRGFGILQLLDAYSKYQNSFPDHNLISGSGIFAFKRENDMCYGLIPHYNKGVTTSLPEINVLSFYHYVPYIYRYYEYIHRKSFWLQYPVNFEPKHLAYTELGFDFRPKLSGWEGVVDEDYAALTTIDFGIGYDPVLNPSHSSHKSILKYIGLNDSEIKKILATRPETTDYLELYKFKSLINT